MRYPEPDRNPRRVRAGTMVTTVAGNDPTKPEQNREVRRPLFIHTTKVMSHRLAEELRSRAHAIVTVEEAAGS